MKERATELEYLTWFRTHAEFGPGESDYKEELDQRFIEETGKNLPVGWNYKQDGETTTDV